MASNVLAWHMWPLKKQRWTNSIPPLQTKVMHRKTWKGTISWCFSLDFMVMWGEISTPFWKDDFKESLATLGTHPLCSFDIHCGQCRSKYQLEELQLKRESVEIQTKNFLAQNILPCLLFCKYLTLLPCLYVVNSSSIISFTSLSTHSCKLFTPCYILRKYGLLLSTAKSPSEIRRKNYIIC